MEFGARCIAVIAAVCGCVAFHIFIYNIHDQLIEVIEGGAYQACMGSVLIVLPVNK